MANSNDDSIESLPKLKECFIITPIGEINSEVFIKANGLINSVIKPVLSNFGFEAIAAHHINNSGSINNQIIKKILESELVIANLTGLNPNVMYELAIRHSARLPVVIMAEKSITPRLPFDITDQRTIFYDDTLSGAESAKPALAAFVKSALEDTKIDNPIYAAASQENIFKQLDEGDPLIAIFEKIDSLSSQVAALSPDKRSYTNQVSVSLLKTRNRNVIKLHILDKDGKPRKIVESDVINTYNQLVEIALTYPDLSIEDVAASNDLTYLEIEVAFKLVQVFNVFYSQLMAMSNFQILVG